MRYSLEPKYRTKVCTKLWIFVICSKIWRFTWQKTNAYCKKTGIDAAKTASKREVQKTAEATGDLFGNKIADKITSVGKSKSKEKKMKQMK